MKIKLSKKKWESLRTSPAKALCLYDSIMDKKLDNFFSPVITLKRHKFNGNTLSRYWYVDLVKDFNISRQLIEDANLSTKKSGSVKVTDEELDTFTFFAGKHGYSVETIGE